MVRLIRWISAADVAKTPVPKGTQNGRVMQTDGAARPPLADESVNKIRHHTALIAFKSEQHHSSFPKLF
jgi:hypothetical protein